MYPRPEDNAEQHQAACGNLDLAHDFDGLFVVFLDWQACCFPSLDATLKDIGLAGCGCGQSVRIGCGPIASLAVKDNSLIPGQRQR